MKSAAILIILLALLIGTYLMVKQNNNTPAHSNLMEKTPNSQFKETPLHQSAKEGDLTKCKSLLAEGLDMNALNEFGWSPLIIAVQNNHFDVAKLLLEAGAPIHYSYQREDTPEERQNQAKEQKMLYDQLNLNDSLKETFKDLPQDIRDELSGQETIAEMAKDMIDMHFEPHTEHATEHCSNLKILQLLVTDHKADINFVASDGTWPLANFTETNDHKAVTWLLNNGADPNTTSTGQTAIFNAIRNDNLDLVKLLLKHGASIKAEDVDGWSVLFPCESVSMAHYLIKNGADPTSLDQAGFPCWHWVDDNKTKEYLKKEAVQRGLEKWTTL